MKMLPVLLAMIAGSTDTISFLGLGGLFTAHITGNFVVLAAHIVNHGETPLAVALSVPVYMAVLLLVRLLATGLDAVKLFSSRLLLLLECVLLAGFLACRVTAGSHLDPNAAIMVLAGMFGVAAMAAQTAFSQISLKQAPSTTVLTMNVSRFVLAVGDSLTGRNADDRMKARTTVRHTWPLIAGFLIGCGLGAACEAAFSVGAPVLPLALGASALVMSFAPDAESSA